MRFLKALVMGWALFFGVQSAWGCCQEKAHCVCPLSDLVTSVEEGGSDPADVLIKCCARCVDITCVWPFAWPCLLPMSCCCPTCGAAAQKTASKEAGVITTGPKGQETAGRVQERKANLTKEDGNT